MPDLAVILVEHEMDIIRRVSDRCVVLNFGRKIFERLFDDLIAPPYGHRSRTTICLFSWPNNPYRSPVRRSPPSAEQVRSV
jgi:ABC-type methionine transport system ATPase subunit